MSELSNRVDEACDQLLRYGGSPHNRYIVLILEKLTDINDDLCNSRDKSIIHMRITSIKELLNHMYSKECGD